MSEILTAPHPLHPDGDDQLANLFIDERYLQAALPDVVKLTPTEKRNARKLIAKFTLDSETNRAKIHYTQRRAFKVKVWPEDGYSGDCSAYPTQAFYYTRELLDGPPFEDPNGQAYSGYGYTGTLLSTNHAHPVPATNRYLVGDLAIYGPFWATRHVVICRAPGDSATAIWSSHGSEIGPLPVRLHYRSDLLTVLRPASLL